MNRIILTSAAAVIAFAGAASAMTNATVESQINTYAPSVDVSALTEAQINALKLSLASGDSAAEKRSFIYSIVNG